jgi:hypothetical protein
MRRMAPSAPASTVHPLTLAPPHTFTSSYPCWPAMRCSNGPLLTLFPRLKHPPACAGTQAAGSSDGAGGTSASGTKTYVLRNALPWQLREHVAPTPRPNRALTLVVLALIHLEGGKMEEGEPSLGELGVGINYGD